MRCWLPLLVPLLLLSVSCAHGAVAKKAVSVRTTSLASSLLKNGQFALIEANAFAGWDRYSAGYDVDLEVKFRGRATARCRNTAASDQRGVSQSVVLNQRTPLPIVAECWSKADGVSAGSGSDYSLYLDLEYMDGTPLWGQISPFEEGTHGWQKRTVTIMPSKPVKRVMVFGLLRSRTGTAWFSDFRLWQIDVPKGLSQFDGVPVEARSAGKERAMTGPVIRTDDGFSLSFDANGDVVTHALGGFMIRDVAAKSDFVRPEAAPKAMPDGSVVREATDPTLGIALSTTYRSVGKAIRIDGTLRDLTGKDRALTVYFTYPVDAVGWTWYDDQRTARKIEPGQKYHNVTNIDVGANGSASRYPLACIAGPKDAIAIAVPLDVPRLSRFGYDADSRELYAAIDLGLSSETAKFPSRASFSLVLYRPDPAWGFRSALERYYQLFPQCFTKRNQKEGIWMPFTDIAGVRGFEDFGFQFKEGNDNVPFDHEHGIYSYVYVEPMSLWLAMPKSMERTRERALSHLYAQATAGDEDAKAALSSALESASGQWISDLRDTPWCDGALFSLNPSPAVSPASGAPTKYSLNWAAIENAFNKDPDLSGTYVDSFEMAAATPNYRREHFRSTDTPLVFDAEGRVCQMQIFNTVEFAKDLATRMWGSGKMTFANSVPIDFPWGAAWFDVMGIEIDWARDGRYAPQPDADMNYWRAMSYQRPYLLLLNTVYEKFKPEWVELYMKRSAAYGIFPSMFSHNASDDPYWQRSDLYERDRPLFKKYIPVIGTLSAAGWQPVTLATASNPEVYVERFGAPGGPVYFTLFNAAEQTQQATITFDAPALKTEAGSIAFRDLLSGEELKTDRTAQLAVTLAAQDLKVLSVVR